MSKYKKQVNIFVDWIIKYNDKFFISKSQQEFFDELFFIIYPSQSKKFSWGVINIYELEKEVQLLSSYNIIYLIPIPQKTENQILWINLFSKIFNSWLIGNIFYTFYHPSLQKQILEVISCNYLWKILNSLKFSDYTEQKKECSFYPNYLFNLNEVIKKYKSRRTKCQDFLDFCDTPEIKNLIINEETELFFFASSNEATNQWLLLDINSYPKELYYLDEFVPGLIQLPEIEISEAKLNISQYVSWKSKVQKLLDTWLLVTLYYDLYNFDSNTIWTLLNQLNFQNLFYQNY